MSAGNLLSPGPRSWVTALSAAAGCVAGAAARAVLTGPSAATTAAPITATRPPCPSQRALFVRSPRRSTFPGSTATITSTSTSTSEHEQTLTDGLEACDLIEAILRDEDLLLTGCKHRSRCEIVEARDE